MSPRKVQGGAELLNRLRDHAVAARDLLGFDRRTLVCRPEEVEERRDDALDYLRLLIAALDTELPPLLERQERNREAASLPDRVAAEERRNDAQDREIAGLRDDLAELRQIVEQRNVTRFPTRTGTEA